MSRILKWRTRFSLYLWLLLRRWLVLLSTNEIGLVLRVCHIDAGKELLAAHLLADLRFGEYSCSLSSRNI
jgi:hypothetical protein